MRYLTKMSHNIIFSNLAIYLKCDKMSDICALSERFQFIYHFCLFEHSIHTEFQKCHIISYFQN